MFEEEIKTFQDIIKKAVHDFETTPCEGGSALSKAEKIKGLKLIVEKIRVELKIVENVIEKGTKEINDHIINESKKFAVIQEMINPISPRLSEHKPVESLATSSTPNRSWNDVVNSSPIVKTIAVPEKSTLKKMEMAPGVYENAYLIKNDIECHEHRGYICYNIGTQKFCYSLNDLIIRGKITCITFNNTPVRKWRTFDQHYGNEDKDGKFYHETDPTDYHWLTNKMEYYPASLPNSEGMPFYAYGIGDRQLLKTDLQCANNQQMSLVRDISGHFALIGLLVSREIAQRQNKKKY